MPETADISLGSNMGARRAAIEAAVDALRATEGVNELVLSEVIETPPVGPTGQGPYYNAVVRLQTTLSPRGLLERCQQIETEHGRDRDSEQRWGSRPLDLDLLLHGDSVIDEPGLTVPHPLMHERDFVLRPLVQIAPGAVHPVLKATAESLLEVLSKQAVGEYAAGHRG